jgi:hypothetical protein
MASLPIFLRASEQPPPSPILSELTGFLQIRSRRIFRLFVPFVPPAGNDQPSPAANGNIGFASGRSACTQPEVGGDVGGIVIPVLRTKATALPMVASAQLASEGKTQLARNICSSLNQGRLGTSMVCQLYLETMHLSADQVGYSPPNRSVTFMQNSRHDR